MPKLIREMRFGPPKSFKTGSIVGTYPRPMLVLELDKGGLDIIPAVADPNAKVKIEVTAKDITTIAPSNLYVEQDKETKDLPPITLCDFSGDVPTAVALDYKPQPDYQSFPAFIAVLNKLLTGKCPWKTVVLDNTTSLSNIIEGHNAAMNPGSLIDARKWAPNIGNKIKAVIAEMTKLPTHFVVIMHESTDKNELTGAISTEPMIYSAYRQIVGGVVSQAFHQVKKNGIPRIETNDNGFIKGLGARWPQLPDDCGVTFLEIYGEAVKNGEIVL